MINSAEAHVPPSRDTQSLMNTQADSHASAISSECDRPLLHSRSLENQPPKSTHLCHPVVPVHRESSRSSAGAPAQGQWGCSFRGQGLFHAYMVAGEIQFLVVVGLRSHSPAGGQPRAVLRPEHPAPLGPPWGPSNHSTSFATLPATAKESKILALYQCRAIFWEVI